MRRIAATLATISALAVASPALASEDTQYWQTLSLNLALPSNFKIQNEAVFRTSDAKGFYELENAVMVGYKLNKSVTVWTGYIHNPTYLHGDFRVMERRWRQQINVDNFAVVGKVKFSGRARLETRWRDGVAGTGWRLRPYVKATAPFVGKSTVSVTHESFINLNTTSFQKTDGYDRMRNAISVSVPLNKKFSMDFGYLNQHGFVRNAEDSSDNVLTLGLSANF